MCRPFGPESHLGLESLFGCFKPGGLTDPMPVVILDQELSKSRHFGYLSKLILCHWVLDESETSCHKSLGLHDEYC